MFNFCICLLGLLVLWLFVAFLYLIIRTLLEKTNLSRYGIESLENPIICFFMIGALIIFQIFFLKLVSGIYLDILKLILFFCILSCVVCIIVDCINDIKDPYGMTKNDYIIRVGINLLFLITIYGIVYWFIYCIAPNSYLFSPISLDGVLRQLVQFWLYSFHVAITYSDGVITAIGISVQIVQVSEVFIFYLVIAKNVDVVFRTK